MTRQTFVRRLAVAAVTVTALASCGSDEAPGTSQTPVGSPTGVAPGESVSPSDAVVTSWLAAIAVAPLADDLDEQTASLKQALGRALVVSPESCFDGLPDQAGSGYILGAVADSREEVVQIVAEAGAEPVFVRSVTILCTD